MTFYIFCVCCSFIKVINKNKIVQANEKNLLQRNYEMTKVDAANKKIINFLQ
jgi:hypothetical protein